MICSIFENIALVIIVTFWVMMIAIALPLSIILVIVCAFYEALKMTFNDLRKIFRLNRVVR